MPSTMQRSGNTPLAEVSVADVITVFGTGNAEAGRAVKEPHATPVLGGTPIDVLVVVKLAPHWPCAFPATQL